MTRWPVAILAAVAVALALGVSIEMRVRNLESKLIPQILEKMAMQTLHNGWRCRRMNVDVTTVQQPGETLADFTARHNAAVTIQVAAYPPDAT